MRLVYMNILSSINSMTDLEQAIVGLGALMGIIVGIGIALWIIQIIAYWKIFTKAGEKGWKSIIPLYNSYTILKLVWKKSVFFIIILISIVMSVSSSFLNDEVILSNTAAKLIVSAISIISSIALIYYSLKNTYKLSKAFGHGIGYTLGLIILNPIFILILGFGKSQYKGNSEK